MKFLIFVITFLNLELLAQIEELSVYQNTEGIITSATPSDFVNHRDYNLETTTFEDHQRMANSLAEGLVSQPGYFLKLSPMPDLSRKCETREKGYVKKLKKCIVLGQRYSRLCPDGSYVESKAMCEGPSYHGRFVKWEGCTTEKIVNGDPKCKLREGLELKANGAIGEVGDGYKKHSDLTEADENQKCSEVTERYVICNGDRYIRDLGTIDSLNRNNNKVLEVEMSNDSQRAGAIQQ